MTTPSGQISLNDVNVELGIPGTTVITMNDSNVRTLAGVGGSGTQISMQNLQGKSNRVTSSATITSNTTNYTLNTAKAPGYSAGTTDMTLTINSGVYVYSTSTGSYALTVDTSWSPGDTVTIVNNGTIIGRGGDGGPSGPATGYPSPSGSGGGPALLVQRALTMNNLARISGGGGGGGGGGSPNATFGKTGVNTSGGGGGGGIGESSGGSAYPYPPYSGGPGSGGTLTSTGGGGFGNYGGPGGSGGSYGANGASGTSVPSYPAGGGGSAGACIVGNSNITYTNTGTRNGSIS